MKIIFYYIALLVFIALLSGFLFAESGNVMSMSTMLTICVAFAVYVVGMSLVGEGKTGDERETAHRYTSARFALIAGTVFMSLAILYQLFTHQLDYLLLASLITINLGKILSLIYQNYKR